ncbi:MULTISPECIES: PilX N-terminal domain-containing pilus assembly protein [unclassified Stenotrophomonas]|uniref:pilus assembly PilX family protein n=1 Tax=unclassified Stenotrophomonas TaxID=196198 RepID=UPI001782DAA6|nr:MULTISPECIES: PilX N-terminal domain-containing pilus assembly protein [unclassified Stenotrophomonas]MBD8635132.1 protein PilX [Stenotrophomonas sp. CFBP 13725]MBD8695117.1 protein PilX [Stenotrophomonas sp. CFBP 13718]
MPASPYRFGPPPRQQRGAVLYVALIMLILLALIGIAGMQVTGMQERMSANYLRTNQAFQNAEADARGMEQNIETKIAGGEVFVATQEECSPSYDPLTWSNGVTATTSSYTRRIDKCFAASSRRVGTRQSEETGNIYQVTALASDDPTNAAASAVIDTIFIP